MIINLNEYAGCFSFELEAENMKDAAMIVRLNVNGVKDLRSINGHTTKEGGFSASVVIGKRKNETSRIAK